MGRRHFGAAGAIGRLVEALDPRRLLSVSQGGEIHVNTFTDLYQGQPAVAMDAEGNYVIAWASNGDDGSGYGVYARRYSASGVTQGGAFRVNTTTTNEQTEPAVAMASDGRFVVTWYAQGQDGDGYGVYAQRYSAAGAAEGTEFQVNTITTGSQAVPAVAIDADGNFVIAWDSADGGDYGIFARRYDSAGVAQGTEFRVNTYTTGFQSDATLAMDDDGNYVVSWTSIDQDASGFGVYAQRFNSADVKQGTEFRVNTFTTGHQLWASAAMDEDGDFLIVWTSRDTDQDGDGHGVFAQRYDAAGAPQGSEFRVNTYTSGDQWLPAVAMHPDGDFVVAWTSNLQDGSGEGIFAREFNAAGASVGGEFRVNTTTANDQHRAAVSMSDQRDFVAAWESSELNDNDTSEVYAQRFVNLDAPFARLIDGTLLVGGTAANDVITLALQGGTLVTSRNGTALNFVNADVDRIEVYALDGNDTVTIGGGIIGAYVLGGNGNDTLNGGDGVDALVGASGKDSLNGGGENDRVAGGKHGDLLFGGDGHDRVYGDEANDLLDGGAGRDRAYGGADNDTMLGANHNDTLYGEGGNDSIHGGNHSDRIFPGTGDDSANGGAGDDIIFAADGSIDHLVGGLDNDGHDSDLVDLISEFEFDV